MHPLFSGYGDRPSTLLLRSSGSGRALDVSYFTRRGRAPTRVQCSKASSDSKEEQQQPLYADAVWPGSLVLAEYLASALEDQINRGSSSNSRSLEGSRAVSVLEMGAGEAALPSLVAIKVLADSDFKVVITDFPKESIFDNISDVLNANSMNHNTIGIISSDDDNNKGLDSAPVVVTRLEWGNRADEERVMRVNSGLQFDIILQAECLWADTYCLHRKLLQSTRALLKSTGSAFVSYADRDAAAFSAVERNAEFFKTARDEFGLESQLILTSCQYCDNDDSSQVRIEVKLVRMWMM